MTAGVPGAGIGGVFYLLSALAAPLWLLVSALTGRRADAAAWRLACRHCLLALTILGAIWLTGWALGRALGSSAGATAFPGAPVRPASAQVLGSAMVYLTLATLAAVLVGVEVLRLFVRRPGPPLVLVWCLLLAPGAMAQPPPATPSQALASALARADQAFEAGNMAAAEREYRAVLSLDPDHSRALFRMGRILGPRDASAAAGYYRHYTIVEPTDAWGHLALASTLAGLGRADQALRAHAEARRLAPTEPDVLLGHPRLLVTLGLVDDAIAEYVRWLSGHPGDGDAWRELANAYQRAHRWRAAIDALERAKALSPGDGAIDRRIGAARIRMAPVVSASLLAVGETDIATWGPAVGGDVAVGETGRFGATYRRRRVSSLGEVGHSQRLGATFTARPRADVQVDVGGGGAWLRPGGAEISSAHVEGHGRVRKTPRAGGIAVDARAHHGPLDLTPELMADPVTATQATGTVDVPVTRTFHLRGLGRAARLTRHDERNTRTGIGGGPVVHLRRGVRVTGQWQQIRNSLPGATGYFAPQRAELADAGLEWERDFDRLSVALDAGAGIQRVQKADAPMGGWARALRAWSYVGWSVAPGRQVIVEVEAYDSQLATIVRTAEKWRHASVTVSFRMSLGS